MLVRRRSQSHMILDPKRSNRSPCFFQYVQSDNVSIPRTGSPSKLIDTMTKGHVMLAFVDPMEAFSMDTFEIFVSISTQIVELPSNPEIERHSKYASMSYHYLVLKSFVSLPPLFRHYVVVIYELGPPLRLHR